MDINEVYMLLMVLEKAHAQGTSFLHIRAAAIDRLNQINAELDPTPKVEEPTEGEEPAEEEQPDAA